MELEGKRIESTRKDATAIKVNGEWIKVSPAVTKFIQNGNVNYNEVIEKATVQDGKITFVKTKKDNNTPPPNTPLDANKPVQKPKSYSDGARIGLAINCSTKLLLELEKDTIEALSPEMRAEAVVSQAKALLEAMDKEGLT